MDLSKSGFSSIKAMLENVQGGAQDNSTPAPGKNELQKDDFVKLMLSQIKHQDPMDPMDNKEMGKQLAQLASLEQLSNLNDGVQSLRFDQKASQERMSLINLIGKDVEVDAGKIDHIKGEKHELTFDFPKNTQQLVFRILDSKGEIVREVKIDKPGGGAHTFSWDGQDKYKRELGNGSFLLDIQVKDTGGMRVPFDTVSTGRVDGLDFRGDKNLLVMKNGNKIPFSQVRTLGNKGMNKSALSRESKFLDDKNQPIKIERGVKNKLEKNNNTEREIFSPSPIKNIGKKENEDNFEMKKRSSFNV